jgi:hypothetical protein
MIRALHRHFVGEELQLLVDVVWLVLLQCLNALTTLVVCVCWRVYMYL